MKPEDIRTQISRISASSGLRNSPRLQEMLSHIVEESLAGRAGHIKGLTIAQAVFSAGEDFDPEANSIVRVEAGRLRRRLAEYYMTAGSDDPIIVDIPKGSYVPRFTGNPKMAEVGKPARSQPRPMATNRYIWLTASVLITVVVAGLVWRVFVGPTTPGTDDESVETLQAQARPSEARVLFRQAFELMLPPEEGVRLGASIQLFERVIEMEPGFMGGYSGKSIALSFQVIFIKSDNPTADLDSSLALAKKAVDIDPESALGYAAMSLVHALRGEADLAVAGARRTMSSQPPDPRAETIAAAALIISGNPEPAIDLLSEAIRLDYDEAAESFEKNLARGGPKGPHMDVFQAAAYLQTGKNFEAQAIVEKLRRTHPDYPVRQWLNNFIKSEDEVLAIVNQLQLLGLSTS